MAKYTQCLIWEKIISADVGRKSVQNKVQCRITAGASPLATITPKQYLFYSTNVYYYFFKH